MSVLGNSQLLMTPEGYQISRSVRLRSSASAYLSRTPASAGNRKTWTWSGWIKRGSMGSTQRVYSVSGLSLDDFVRFNSDDRMMVWFAAGVGELTTQQVFRDPSAWYHVVYAVDSTQATSTNRVKLYVNGAQVTVFSTAVYPTQNADGATNAALTHFLGRYGLSSIEIFDGYLTEVNFIDGQALTPSSFGETNPVTGVWQPKKYAGTYGTNGFYLNFSDPSAATAAAIGKDYSGNGNNWTPNNVSVTAGVTYDSMLDVPTPYADGGNGRGNYCTLNPLRNTAASQGTISSGNLQVTGTNGVTNAYAAGTMVFSEKMYCEFTITAAGSNTTTSGVGVVPISSSQFATAGSMATGIYYTVNGNKRITNVSSSYGSSYTTGDVIGVAVDVGAETVTFYKNNVSQGSISGTGVISTGVFPYIGFEDAGSPTVHANFGQRPFAYTPPTGFKALNTQNLPEPTIKKGNQYFDASLYTGTNASLTITNSGSMQPDLVWVKVRSQADQNVLCDAVRGVTKRLYSNLTNAEDATGGLVSINSSGFVLGDAATSQSMNNSGQTYVAWQWKAGGTPAVTNTAGSITSTVSANTTSGFSVVTYTGNATNGATVGHGLGIAPKMIIFKRRNGVDNWPIYNESIGATKTMFLDLTNASATSAVFNNTAPTSSVFTVSNFANVNASSGTYVAYCFAEVPGFSKFGSYTGNGSTDGPFVFTNFKPRFILVKQSSAAGENWEMWDSERGTYNINTPLLYSNLSNAETAGTAARFDVLSNGFKVRSTNAGVNASGGTYIFAAFAEHPFKNALAR